MNTLISASAVSKQVTAPDGAPLHILSRVDLQVNAGEAVALLGASGSGKSTLLGLLAGLDQPSTGDIDLLGEPLVDMDEDRRAALRRGQVGFVFQSFQLLPGMTALENVALPLQLLSGRGGARAAQQQARDILGAVGLGQRMEHLPRQLSGGEQQRVALARAFVVQPRVLFADEPTGNLDTETGAQIIDLLFALRDSANTALLLVTHDSAVAARCDRTLRLSGGRLSGSA